jgi:hypothetical protein
MSRIECFRFFQRFGKHLNFHLQGEYLLANLWLVGWVEEVIKESFEAMRLGKEVMKSFS